MYVDVADDIREKGYVAVSHVWGDQRMYSADELDILDGVSWEIPLSDPEKIGRLVDAMKYYEMEYCWWDILCMPQDKQDEINLEIPFMGDYYNNADITLVLSDESYVISDDYPKWRDMASDIMKEDRDPTLDETTWMINGPVLLDFCGDKWFTRVWTLQEAVLSKKVILVDLDWCYFDLSNLVHKLGYMMNISIFHAKRFTGFMSVFGGINALTHEYNNGRLDLATALQVNVDRCCYKEHDRFYGVFGMLGYKDFSVGYDMSIDDLNMHIVRYAYSKGDISWMTVVVDGEVGLIQSMYKEFRKIGLRWRESTPGICNIRFEDSPYVDGTEFGVVTSCKKFVGDPKKLDEFIPWVVHSLNELELDNATMFDAIVQYVDGLEEFMQIGIKFLETIAKNNTFYGARAEVESSLTGDDYLNCMKFDSLLGLNVAGDPTVIAAAKTILGKVYPLMICGDADIGDKVVVPKIHDTVDRNIGIVTSGCKRKGICPVPSHESVLISHKFLYAS
jgi:hypothetical protein